MCLAAVTAREHGGASDHEVEVVPCFINLLLALCCSQSGDSPEIDDN